MKKQMNFTPEMAALLLAGKKTQTIRLVWPQPFGWVGNSLGWKRTPDQMEYWPQCLARPGICPYGDPGDLANAPDLPPILITSVAAKFLIDITGAEARADGFAGVSDCRRYLWQCYADKIQHGEVGCWVWVIGLEVQR